MQASELNARDSDKWQPSSKLSRIPPPEYHAPLDPSPRAGLRV